MNRSSTVGMPSLRTPPSGLGISTRLTGCGSYVPLNNCSRMTGQCCFRYSGNCGTVIPSTPALPLFALTRFNACLQFSRPQTSSINCSAIAGLSIPRCPADDSVPSGRPFGASPLSSSMKANSSWFFCRLSPMSRAAYSPLPLPSLRRTVWAFIRCRTTTPAADFCRPVRMDRSTLSPDSRTNGRSPEVSSTAFRTQPPNLQPVPLMDMGFAITCPLARHRMPQIRFLYIGSYVCSTLLSDPPSPERPCASLLLHLHQVVEGTFTPELSNMLGTQTKGAGHRPAPSSFPNLFSRLRYRLRLLGGARFLVLPLKLVDAAGGVHQLLLAGEEGVAGWADFH